MRRQPTAWTPPLQIAVIGALVVGVIGAVTSGAFRPQGSSPIDYGASLLLWATYAAWVVLTAIGTVKRWTWLYWVTAAIFLTYWLGVGYDSLALLGNVQIRNDLGPRAPAFGFVHDLAHALVGLAMCVVGATIGPWGSRRWPMG